MATRHGGAERVSTKTKLADELVVLGAVIARARERAALRQADVAHALGLPASYLSKVEKGTRRLDVIEFVRLAEAMSLDPAELLRELQAALGERPPGA